MTYRTRAHCHGVRGFSLIELIVAIVVLSIGTIAVVTMMSQVGRGQTDNNDFQTAVQLIQECAEKILATRRRATTGYVLVVTSTTCGGLSTFAGAGFDAPAVTVTPYTNPPNPACPAGATCNLATISVSKGSTTFPSVSLMLVNY